MAASGPPRRASCSPPPSTPNSPPTIASTATSSGWLENRHPGSVNRIMEFGLAFPDPLIARLLLRTFQAPVVEYARVTLLHIHRLRSAAPAVQKSGFSQ